MQRPSAPTKSYEQVELTPLGPDASSIDDKMVAKSSTQTWLEYIWRKLVALLWIVIAAAIAWYIKLPDVIIDSYTPGNAGKQLAVFWFNVGLAGFAGWVTMAAYLVVWLKYIKRIEVEWEEYSPRAIPIATVCAIGSLLGCVHRPTARVRRPHATLRSRFVCCAAPPPPRAHASLADPFAVRAPQLHLRLLARLGHTDSPHHLVPLPGRLESGALCAVVDD